MAVRYLLAVANSTERDAVAKRFPGVVGLVYQRDDNSLWAVDPDGATTFAIAGASAATTGFAAALGVAGVAAGYRIARGVTALDGSNPTPVVTGLTTVVAAVVSLEGTAAPGLGTSVLTVASTNYATGALAVYAWKPTDTDHPDLIASTGTENFEWIAVGT